MDSSQLQQFEALCGDLYSSSNADARKAAHDILMPLLAKAEAIPQLEFALANSMNPHTILFASNGLLQLVTAHWTSLVESQREDLRAFLLPYLVQKCSAFYGDPVREQALNFIIRLLCRIVKLSWLDGPKHQAVTGEIKALIDSGSMIQAVLAVDIYTALAVEMQPSKGANVSRNRRTAMSFRDVALASIFQTAMKILQNLPSIQDKSEEGRLLQKVLKLVVTSLSFDFMGTMPDETADDQATVMVPYTWTAVKDLSYPSLFFSLYQSSVSNGRRGCAVLCLQCLVLFASLRRSLYSREEERTAMLNSCIDGTELILASRLGLDDDDCYHEFCRLLGRINAANQLTELSNNPRFAGWIERVFAFTSTALARIDHLPNSMHYLLGFWTVLVAPTISMGAKAPGTLKQFLEQTLVLFLQSRVGLNEPVEDETLLYEQLDVVTTLSKLHLESATRVLVSGLESARSEHQLVWVMYLMGAVVSGQSEGLVSITTTRSRRSASMGDSGSDTELFTATQPVTREYECVGELLKRGLMLITKSATSNASEELELAYLYFLDQFKRVYLAEQAKITALQTSRAEGTSRLCQAIGISSDAEVLDLFVGKIFGNLQTKQHMESVIKKTLGFANDLINGSVAVYTDPAESGRTLASALCKNERMQYLLSHHEAITFDRIDKNFASVYYSIVFRLIFAEKLFPINWAYFDSLFAQLVAGGSARTADNGKLVVTLARNLKGLSLASTCFETYSVGFKYLVENVKNSSACKISLFSAAADLWWDEPQVVVPVLKFIADFAHNRGQRIAFDTNSPNGLVLFREAVKVMSAYGQRMLQRPQTFVYRDLYEEKYKGIGAALALFTNALGGGYANLGVFELFGDNSLQLAMSTALNLCLSIPQGDLSAYLKSLKSVYTFIELVTKSHMSALVQLAPHQFANILKALEDGLTSFETAIALSCCNAIDCIATFLVETVEGEDVAAVRGLVADAQVRASIARLLAMINHLSMSGEFASTWSLSRPFLGLILIAKDEFMLLKSQIVQQQTNIERSQFVETAYEELMKGIVDNLTTKNRELFTKNLYNFSMSLRSK